MARKPNSAPLAVRAARSVVLGVAGLTAGWGFAYWPVAVALFVAAVIVAPNEWFKGYAGSRGTAGPYQ